MALCYWNENCERCEVFHWFQRKYLTTKKQDRIGDPPMWTSHKPEAWGLGFRCVFGALGSWPSPVIPKLWSSQWEISKIVNVPSLVNCPPFPLFPSWDPRLKEDQGVDSGGLFTLSVRVNTPLGEIWRSMSGWRSSYEGMYTYASGGRLGQIACTQSLTWRSL